MNGMIEFAKSKRTTTYFRNYAVLEIQIAYRIMEYLSPDSVFPAKDLYNITKNAILAENYPLAFANVIDELDSAGFSTDIGSSWGMEALQADAIDLMAYLKPLYVNNIKDAREKKRAELLKELSELDKIDTGKEG